MKQLILFTMRDFIKKLVLHYLQDLEENGYSTHTAKEELDAFQMWLYKTLK